MSAGVPTCQIIIRIGFITVSGRDIEPNLPDKRTVLIPVFQHLSSRLGKERVIWRYDPILLNGRYTAEYHVKAFEEIAGWLDGYTEKVVISFVDLYAKAKRNLRGLEVREPGQDEMVLLAETMARIGKKHGMVVETCAEKIDLGSVGVGHGSCIDQQLIERLTGCSLKAGRDKNQRGACGCVQSIDVGSYHTCRNGCRYCYANFSDAYVEKNVRLYDRQSPLLCGYVKEDDTVTERVVKSLKEGRTE